MQVSFTDTHCHIHDPTFFSGGGESEYQRALAAGVGRMICVGTDEKSSVEAVEFARVHDYAWAAVGIHPHDAKDGNTQFNGISELLKSNTKNLKSTKIVAIGEIGLDYYYENSPRQEQILLLEKQIDLALSMSLPVIFHVRNAFDDFWPILANFSGVRGVLHSFTDTIQNMEKGIEAGFYVGVNGIATFARELGVVTRAIPVENMLFETDAPFLTPAPKRGKVNEPANIQLIASYVAELRGTTVEELSRETERSANRLFF